MAAPLSYWHDSLAPGDSLQPRPALPGATACDVAVVGAGFAGLWTAHSLLAADPTLRVVVLERDTAGFGASGRNGGWCVGHYSGPIGTAEKRHGRGSAAVMGREMARSVDEVGRVVTDAGIDCGFHKGGAINVADDAGQWGRLRKLHAQFVRAGLGDDWLLYDARAARAVVDVPGLRGALFTPHAAAVHPARLARGLAVEVERLGGTIHEGTAVARIDGHVVHTAHGTVRADVVVRTTEAYTSSIEGHERAYLPLGNDVIATEPIDDATWARIGLADRQLFELSALMLGYGQRTADGRFVWGGLSAQSTWGDGVPASPMHPTRIADRLRRRLVALFPVLDGVGVSHHWGGVMGVPRDLLPGVGYDRSTGFAWGGGFNGQGVAAANAAGRTLAALILGLDDDVVRLPWVNHRSRPWEGEPRRWLGVHAVTTAAHVVDWVDRRRR